MYLKVLPYSIQHNLGQNGEAFWFRSSLTNDNCSIYAHLLRDNTVKIVFEPFAFFDFPLSFERRSVWCSYDQFNFRFVKFNLVGCPYHPLSDLPIRINAILNRHLWPSQIYLKIARNCTYTIAQNHRPFDNYSQCSCALCFDWLLPKLLPICSLRILL